MNSTDCILSDKKYCKEALKYDLKRQINIRIFMLMLLSSIEAINLNKYPYNLNLFFDINIIMVYIFPPLAPPTFFPHSFSLPPCLSPYNSTLSPYSLTYKHIIICYLNVVQ